MTAAGESEMHEEEDTAWFGRPDPAYALQRGFVTRRRRAISL